MSKLSFVSFCIEHYAQHIKKASNDVYELFKREKVIEFLENDYNDLHGMGIEYVMQIIDEYLGAE